MERNARTQPWALLKLAISPPNAELATAYQAHVAQHNEKQRTSAYPDSGFDLLLPSDTVFEPQGMVTQFVPLGIRTEMTFMMPEGGEGLPTAYDIYARSSMSKTPLMLSNHVGIIDMGYRGELTAAFRLLSSDRFLTAQNTRLLQICHPSRCPIYVEMVDPVDLTTTERGDGAFGSTGR